MHCVKRGGNRVRGIGSAGLGNGHFVILHRVIKGLEQVSLRR